MENPESYKMNIVLPASDQRKRLLEFLNNLYSMIDREVIQSEAQLESFVQVESQTDIELQLGRGYEKTPASATLLEILGYEYEDVQNHPTKRVIIGQVKYAPDYILHRKHSPFAILDLKTPATNIDNPSWKAQIYNYCRDENLPIGILFNGRKLRVFINTNYRGLTKYGDIFKGEPIASAEHNEPKQMLDLLLKLSATSLENSSLAVARELANKRKKEIGTVAWRRNIEDCLKSILADPPAEMMEALASLNLWGEQKPSGEVLDAIWAEFKSRPAPIIKKRENRFMNGVTSSRKEANER